MPVRTDPKITRDPPLLSPLAVGMVVTGPDGAATISFPAWPSKPTILLMPDSDQVVAVVAGWVTDASGNYTGATVKTYKLVPSLSTTSTTAVTGVSTTTATVVSGVSTSTGTFVTGIPTATGDAAGRYSVDSAGVVHHTHAIGSPTTASAVTGVSTSTTTVVSRVSTTTASVLTGASLSAEAAPNVAVFYLILP